ncbi:MAG: ferredoxin [Paenirhodobacter sp.]|uniref:ferredoxin n=1 Tax=Paenirhodobacter sp. TaxID=1965326 RepID=UPI003D118009
MSQPEMSLPGPLRAALAAERLFVSGLVAEGAETIALLSPDEPGFWAHVTAAPEFADGAPDPLDRWSERVIGRIAAEQGARALFPFGGPPHQPFFAWALRSGQAVSSPVRLMAHARMGLWASFRGALALPGALVQVAPAADPCAPCAAPCTRVCPVGAMSREGYNVPLCHDFLDTPEGAECLERGCLARRACPIGQTYGRLEVQSAWHMRHFHR